MLRMVQSRPGYVQPIVVCDECGQRIQEVKRAMYIWEINPADNLLIPATGTVYFLHKACLNTFERTRVGTDWIEHELSRFPLLLSNSLGIDWNQLDEEYRKFGDIFF